MDTDDVATLIEMLAAELERPRELSARVLNYIVGNYGIDQDAVGHFLAQELPRLEDYEIDLILSPVFTPKLADQAVFAEWLGRKTIPREEWPVLIEQLAARPTHARLVTPDGVSHSVPLREVTIERYVHRLRLDGTMPEPLLHLLDQTPPASDRPLLKAIARRPIWETDARSNILAAYITNALSRGAYGLADAIELLNVVETNKPAEVDDLLAWIPRRQDALREQINTGSGGKPFFSQRVQELHGGDRDQRLERDGTIVAKENEVAFLDRLLQVLTP